MQSLVFYLSAFVDLFLFGFFLFQTAFLLKSFHPILDQFFGPVELFLFDCDSSEVAGFVVLGVDFILNG